jgi:hypothetical protein
MELISKAAISKVQVIAIVAIILVAAIIGVAAYYFLRAAPKPRIQ